MFFKHSNDIVIKRFSDTVFTSEDVHRLVDEAWQRWFVPSTPSIASPYSAASASPPHTSPPGYSRTAEGI